VAKPVLVSVMYLPKAQMRRDSVHLVVLRPREETSFSRTSRVLGRAGQVRQACWKVSGQDSQQGQVRFGFSSNQERCAVR